jgi:hypothetical protein
MKIISKVTFGLVILLILVGCHKEKKCIGNSFSPIPFWEIFADFGCNSNNLPYQYVLWNQSTLDSLISSHCYFANTQLLPVDDSGYVYLAVGDSILNIGDTITTQISKDTCNKIINYDVSFVQRTKNHANSPGIASVFCILDRVSPDYKVFIKKSRINLP